MGRVSYEPNTLGASPRETPNELFCGDGDRRKGASGQRLRHHYSQARLHASQTGYEQLTSPSCSSLNYPRSST